MPATTPHIDPGVLSRTFSHLEIFPVALGCHEDGTFALHGTPLDGAAAKASAGAGAGSGVAHGNRRCHQVSAPALDGATEEITSSRPARVMAT